MESSKYIWLEMMKIVQHLHELSGARPATSDYVMDTLGMARYRGGYAHDANLVDL